MSVGKVKGTGNWYCQYRVEGKKSPVKEYFSKGEAGKKAAVDRDLEIKSLKNNGKEIHPSSMRLDELGQLYINYKARLLRRKRLVQGKEHLKLLVSKLNNDWLPLLSTMPIERLKPSHFEQVHALYDGKSVATQNRYMDYLNTLLNYGVKLGHIKKNPMADWWRSTRQKESSRDLVLTLDEFRSLYDHAAPHLQWVLEVMWETGARPGVSELFSLKWDDVNWDAKTLHIRGTKTRQSNRTIPISDKFKQRLSQKFEEAQTEYVLEYRGKRLKGVRRSLIRAKKAAKIDDKLCLYHIRHLFTTTMLANGADIKAVAALLGHSSPQMIFKVYYHLIEEKKEEAIRNKPALVA